MAAQVRTPTWSQVTSSATHIKLFFINIKSPALPLFTVPTYFRFSFFSISLPLSCSSQWYPGLLNVWGHLRDGLRIAMPQSCTMEPGRGHLSCSLRLPSTRLVVTSGKLPVSAPWQVSGDPLELAPHQVCLRAPCKGCASWTYSLLGLRTHVGFLQSPACSLS